MRGWTFVLTSGVLVCAVGCGDRTPPRWGSDAALAATTVSAEPVTLTWPAATDESGEISYRVLRGEEVVAEPAAADAMQHVVDGLAEFSEYSFSVQAVDLAGNASEPLTLTVRTADNTPPTWAEGCELAATVVDEDDLDKGLQLAWCEATDNDRMERFSIRRYGTEIASAPPQQLEHTHLERPLDGSYSVAACDPSGNCSPLERVPMYPERDERMAEVTHCGGSGGASRQELGFVGAGGNVLA